MKAVVIACLVAVLLLLQTVDCRKSHHSSEKASDSVFAELLRRMIEKTLSKKTTLDVEEVREEKSQREIEADEQAEIMEGLSRSLVGSKADIMLKGNWFQTVPTCPAGTVMDLAPFGMMTYPALRSYSATGEVPTDPNCSYTITVPEGEQVYFLYMTTNRKGGTACTDGQLDIYDGAKTDDNKPFIHLCGSSMPNIITSSTNVVYVDYKAGEFGSGGFMLYYINSGSADF